MRTIQIPEDALLAEQDQVFVDRIVTSLIREGVGEWAGSTNGPSRGSLPNFRSVLDRVRDATPVAGDEL